MLFDIYDIDWIFLHLNEVQEKRNMQIQLTVTEYEWNEEFLSSNYQFHQA